MNIFEFESYKEFVKKSIQEMPKGGRGQYRRLAQQLKISTTLVSQIFNGDKSLTWEHASDLADYFSLSEDETDYLFLLVQQERAATLRLRQKLQRRVEKSREHAKKLENRLNKDVSLSEKVRLHFYSDWSFSGIRMLTATEQGGSVDAIAQRLRLPSNVVKKVVAFLLENGLCVMQEGRLAVGPRRTHLGADSPLVNRHHQNWRLLSSQTMCRFNPSDLFYTAPMSLSEETAQRIRRELPSFIEKINKWVYLSPSEVVRCLNIDWFEY